MFETHGIHTRLHYIVKRVGGWHRQARVEYLRNTYGFDDETIKMVYQYNIEKLLKDKTLDDVLSLIKAKEDADKHEAEQASRRLNNLMHQICLMTDMLPMASTYNDLIFGRRRRF